MFCSLPTRRSSEGEDLLNRAVNACLRSSGTEGILPTQTAATDGGILVGPETDYSLSTTATRDAIRHRRQFNIIHVRTGLKLDLNQRKTTDFGASDCIGTGTKMPVSIHPKMSS